LKILEKYARLFILVKLNNIFKGEDFMKKFFLCLFVLLSFSIFAGITTDGKPHFDKMIGRKIDKNGIVYGYDTAKKKVAFLRENLEVIYYEGQ